LDHYEQKIRKTSLKERGSIWLPLFIAQSLNTGSPSAKADPGHHPKARRHWGSYSPLEDFKSDHSG
jgi:hypothetical protein